MARINMLSYAEYLQSIGNVEQAAYVGQACHVAQHIFYIGVGRQNSSTCTCIWKHNSD